MMKTLVVAGLIGGMLALAATPAGARSTHHSCGSIGGEYLHIRVTNTTCKVAKNSVIFYEMQGLKAPGWKCSAKVKGRNSDVTCRHHGGKVVAYVFHG